MELARERAERALDLRAGRSALDAEHLVVVALRRRHRRRSDLLVHVLDEPRELEGRGAHGADRLLVVHAQRADRGRPRRAASSGSRTSRRRARRGGAGRHRPRGRRGRPGRRGSSASLTSSSTAARRSSSSSSRIVASSSSARTSSSRPTEPPTKTCGPSSEPGVEHGRPTSSRNARSRGPRSGASSVRRTALEPSRSPTSCSFRYSPAHAMRPESTGSSKRNDALCHSPGRGDHDDHDAGRLQREDLDMPDGRRLERGRGDEREQPGRAGERLRWSSGARPRSRRAWSRDRRRDVPGAPSIVSTSSSAYRR